ncbi:hypothetical protein L7F22_044573 [Adiantum nelumboides]|nr:hypothetical protein [Adiantum nelumboides]
MPVTSEYSAYTSKDAGKQFAQAIKDVYWDRLKKDIATSPFYSIQIDESTEIRTQQYMIVYVTYMQDGGNGSITTCFMDLLPAKSSDAEALHDSLLGFLTKLELPLQKMIGIATDGASVMTGASNGVVSRLKRSIPHLLSFHCIAHRESLATGDAFKTFKEFKFVNKVARKLYEWVCRSAKRHAILADIVNAFGIGRHGKLKLLKMHDVRWLSKGQVMERVIRMMPALLTVLFA